MNRITAPSSFPPLLESQPFEKLSAVDPAPTERPVLRAAAVETDFSSYGCSSEFLSWSTMIHR